MGRYIERVENTARLVQVTESFTIEDNDGGEAWAALLNVFAELENFEKLGKPANAKNVARFFLTRKTTPSSVISNLALVKENARSLRHLLSTECWMQVSRFYSRLEEIAKKSLALSKLSGVCREIRAGCHEHFGVLEATCYRDEVWLFNRIGAGLERADQMTRLVDMKYFQIDVADTGDVAPPDTVWWNSLLRSASGYHAFRRRHSFNPDPEDAAAFLLFDKDFPRSVCASMDEAFWALDELAADYDAAPDEAVAGARDALKKLLAASPATLHGRALHDYIDDIQARLIALSGAIADRYFTQG